jgi:hypothetical protein
MHKLYEVLEKEEEEWEGERRIAKMENGEKGVKGTSLYTLNQ